MWNTVSLAKSQAIGEIVFMCCVQVELPSQNCTAIRRYDVLEGNGFVCLRMYAFPVVL